MQPVSILALPTVHIKLLLLTFNAGTLLNVADIMQEKTTQIHPSFGRSLCASA